MLKAVSEKEVPAVLREMISTQKNLRIAVPFWGKDAISLLGLEKADHARILVNPIIGHCDKDVIGQLEEKFDVYAHRKLHAKIYLTDTMAVIGSSNASSNGLSDDFESSSGLREMNIVTDDKSIIKDLSEYFENLWSEKISIVSEMFKSRFIKTYSGEFGLLELAKKQPQYFKDKPIYFMLYKRYADKNLVDATKEKVDSIRDKDKFFNALGSYSDYYDWKDFPKDSWLIEVSNCRKEIFQGIYKSYSNIKKIKLDDGVSVDLAFKQKNIIFDDGTVLVIDENEQRLIQEAFDRMWNLKAKNPRDNEQGVTLSLYEALSVL